MAIRITNSYIQKSTCRMKIGMTTDMQSVESLLLEEANVIENETIRMLARLGEMCVNYARDRSPEESWNDQTGNLRSSIGYAISRKGEVVLLSKFPAVKDGSEGSKTGKDLALELAKRLSDDFALVLEAGMKYASDVEAMDNKDVLASAELYGRNELPEMLRQLGMKLNRKLK